MRKGLSPKKTRFHRCHWKGPSPLGIRTEAAFAHEIKVEPTTGIEPVNLFLTKEVLYLLSYVGWRKSSQYFQERSIVWCRNSALEVEKQSLLAVLTL
jgi:hypothetical protein